MCETILQLANDVCWVLMQMVGFEIDGIVTHCRIRATCKDLRALWDAEFEHWKSSLPFSFADFLYSARMCVWGSRTHFDDAMSRLIRTTDPVHPPGLEVWEGTFSREIVATWFVRAAALHDNIGVVKWLVEHNTDSASHPDEAMFSLISQTYLQRTLLSGEVLDALRCCGKDWYPFHKYKLQSHGCSIYERPHATPHYLFRCAPPSFVKCRCNHDVVAFLLEEAGNLLKCDGTSDVPTYRNVQSVKLARVAFDLIAMGFWFVPADVLRLYDLWTSTANEERMHHSARIRLDIIRRVFIAEMRVPQCRCFGSSVSPLL